MATTNNKKKSSKYVWIITRTEKEIKTGQEVDFFERVCSNKEKVERYLDYIEKVECEEYKNISGEREICASCLHLHLKNEEKTISIWAKRELIF